jgi:hypothetical protein
MFERLWSPTYPHVALGVSRNSALFNVQYLSMSPSARARSGTLTKLQQPLSVGRTTATDKMAAVATDATDRNETVR